MRIIGGRAKGRRLYVPPGSSVRPTSDRIKEALFNILGPLEGQTFLDLYAGTGNVGLEALSRGAAFVVFVEKIPGLALAIRRNLDLFGFSGRSDVTTLDAEKGLVHLAEQGLCFDLIFADPPYRKGGIGKILSVLNAHPALLAEKGTLIIQHALAEPLELEQGMAFELIDARKYGDTLLSFLRLLTP